MANEQNLIPQAHVLTVEEASKGGKNSAEKRKKTKTLNEIMTQWANNKITQDGLIERMVALGFDEDVSNKAAAGMGMWSAAVSGSAAGFDRFIAMINEPLPVQEVTINVKKNPFEGMSTEELRKLINDDQRDEDAT